MIVNLCERNGWKIGWVWVKRKVGIGETMSGNGARSWLNRELTELWLCVWHSVSVNVANKRLGTVGEVRYRQFGKFLCTSLTTVFQKTCPSFVASARVQWSKIVERSPRINSFCTKSSVYSQFMHVTDSDVKLELFLKSKLESKKSFKTRNLFLIVS